MKTQNQKILEQMRDTIAIRQNNQQALEKMRVIRTTKLVRRYGLK